MAREKSAAKRIRVGKIMMSSGWVIPDLSACSEQRLYRESEVAEEQGKDRLSEKLRCTRRLKMKIRRAKAREDANLMEGSRIKVEGFM